MLHDLTIPRLALWLREAVDQVSPDRASRLRDAGTTAVAWLHAAESLQRKITGRVAADPEPEQQWRLSPGDLVAMCRLMGADPAKITLADFLARSLPPAVAVETVPEPRPPCADDPETWIV